MFPGTGRRYSVILVTVICENRLLGLKKPSDDIFGLRIFVVAFFGLEILELIFLGGRGVGKTLTKSKPGVLIFMTNDRISFIYISFSGTFLG